MSDTTKEKILKINTQGAEKNVKSLKTQIRELKEQLAGLEKGTAEYDAISKKLADTNQKQIEINEAMKYSNSDLGATLSNLTKATAGVVGAISSVNAVMTLMGADSEEAMEAMKTLQSLMAIIQGLSAIDTAIKAVKGLSNAFSTLNQAVNTGTTTLLAGVEGGLETAVVQTTGAIQGETTAIKANTTEKIKNAGATETMAGAEGNVVGKQALSGWAKLNNFVKAIGVGIKAMPGPLKVIGVVALAIVGVFKLIDHFVSEANKELREKLEYENTINMEYKKQEVEMESLLRMFKAQNTTQEQKEVLAKEINKLANDELVVRNKITGEWELSNEKVEEYIKNLRTSIELEYHKKQILESMDREEEARNDAIYERTHFIGNLWRTEEGYLEDAADEVAIQEKHWREIEKLTVGTVKNIEKENKELKKTTGGGGIKKTFTDLFKELKALWKDFYAQLTKEKEIKRTFNGIYSEVLIAYDKAVEAINGSMLGKKISKDFVKAFEGGLKDIKSNEITLDMIFVDTNELDKQLNDAKKELRKLFDEGKKVTDKEVQNAKNRIDSIKEEIAGYEAIAKYVYDYKKALEDLEKTRKETSDANALYNKQQDINTNYRARIRREQGSYFQYEETNKEIEQQKLLYQTTMKRLTEEKARLDELNQSNLRNKATIEEIAELEKKIAEDQKAANEAQIQMDELRYKNRLTKLEEIYAGIEKEYELEQQSIEIERNQEGGGVSDFNTEVDLIELQLQAIADKANAVDDFYKKLQEQHDKNSQEWYVLEQERLAAQDNLQDEYRKKEYEKDKAQADRRLNIQKTFISAYQGISSQIGNILSAEMERYDENSKEYKNLKYTQGIINTGEGVLAAYMSGFESGIPWPGNVILAGVLSSLALAAGIMQLNNIKNEKLGGSMPSTVNVGSEYDTLSYQTNVDTLSAIQDQRVIVVESDITDTQNRVRVSESAAMF